MRKLVLTSVCVVGKQKAVKLQFLIKNPVLTLERKSLEIIRKCTGSRI